MKITHYVSAMAAVFAVFFVSACSTMNTTATAAQADSLALVAVAQFKEYYRKSDTDLSKFSRIAIEPCEVNFRKNWLRDQNANRTELANRVTEKDVNRIKNRMSKSCNDKFRESLEQSTVYKLVDNYDGGEPVLILRPSIIDLDVYAPDLRGAGFTRSFSKSSGEMTLSLDLVDSATGEVLARAVDRRRDHENISLEPISSVTNQVNFDRSFRRWAKLLRSGLDQATL